MNDVETAEMHLRQVAAISTCHLRLARKLAKSAACVVVDGNRLAALEALLTSCADAFGSAKMTCDYKDVQTESEPHDGKRWLLNRAKGLKIFEQLSSLKPRLTGPQGCMVRD